ncbi:MAG: hypothetical protein IJI73_06030 [Kiritimatiellae bacterium]|nr:hypothetical protein [Kiritimatiellia bacterium]
MPIGIDAYRNLGAADIGQLAILRNPEGEDRIGTASDKGLNFLQRLFNTGASKKVNIEIANDFKASMVAAYGQKVTEEVLASTIGATGFKGAKLSARLVQAAITRADEYVAQRLNIPQTADAQISLRIEGRQFSVAAANLGQNEKKALAEAKSLIGQLNALLMEMPTDTVALQDFSERLTSAKESARWLLESEIPLLTFPDEATDALNAATDALAKLLSLVDGKLAEARDVCEKNPLTYKALSEFVAKYVDGAINAVSGLKNGGADFGLSDAAKSAMPGIMAKLTRPDGLLKMLADAANVDPTKLGDASPKQLAEIRRAIPEPDANYEYDICPDPRAFIGKEFEKKIAEFCAAIVKQELEAIDPKLSEKFSADSFKETVAKETLREFGAKLNSGNWDPISKDVTFALGDRAYKGKSVITPASHMGGAVGELYNDGGPRGYNSHSYGEKKHAVNLANTKFEIDVVGTPKTLFSGIRHGVHAAIDVADEAEFKNANLSRAKETVIAAFTSRQDLVDEALAHPERPVKVFMSSVSLLTPDFARALSSNKQENEKLMLQAQTEAYRALDGKTIEIEVPVQGTDPSGNPVTIRQKVKIQPQVATFNYGVNWGGVGFLSGLFGGWGPSGDVNGSGLAKLERFVSEKLGQLDSDFRMASGDAERNAIQKKMSAIETLRSQIRQIDRSKSFKSDGHEAYKMASRIAVLSYLCGGVPAWNCKSGKDRTGMMDVECKFLATLVELGDEIPAPGAQLTTEQRLLYRNILLQGGNHEMQRYNTGIAGYKLEGVDSITERIGDADAQKVFLGGSKIVQS